MNLSDPGNPEKKRMCDADKNDKRRCGRPAGAKKTEESEVQGIMVADVQAIPAQGAAKTRCIADKMVFGQCSVAADPDTGPATGAFSFFTSDSPGREFGQYIRQQPQGTDARTVADDAEAATYEQGHGQHEQAQHETAPYRDMYGEIRESQKNGNGDDCHKRQPAQLRQAAGHAASGDWRLSARGKRVPDAEIA